MAKKESKNRPFAWGPRLPEGGAKGTAQQKSATYDRTLADLKAYRSKAGKNEKVLGVNTGPNSVAIDRAATTGNRLNDYSKTAGRAGAAALKAKKAALAKMKAKKKK